MVEEEGPILMVRICLIVFTCCCLAQGQSAEKPLTFEAASVKPATPPVPDAQGRIFSAGPTGGPGTTDPGRIHYPNMSLKNLLMSAYDMKSFQIVGPAWLDTERFEINATLPANTTKEQFRGMLQNLLVERFKLAIHRASKELPMYSLEVAKGGPKIKESAETAAPPDAYSGLPAPPWAPKMGADGFPILPQLAGRPGIFNLMMPGRARMVAQLQTMQDLAARLSSQLNRPVTDATGLKAKYDFTLTFSPEGTYGPMGPIPSSALPPPGASGAPAPASPPDDVETPPDIFKALQAQLGLKLESKKGPVELIVIDHVEKTPTEN